MRKILFFLFFLIVLEITARIIYFPQDRLEKILNILEQDSLLFWRHKPHLDVLFENSTVKTNSQGFRADKDYPFNKKKDFTRIICLGDSSTFGWGIPFKNSYPQQLENILRNNYPLINFEVINTGIIGYSSYQGLLFLQKKILRYSPDIITIAYMINDLDRYRFFRSNGRPDKELSLYNPLIVFLKNMLQRINLYNLAAKGIPVFNAKRKYIPGLKSNIDMPQIRVSAEDYRYNLEKIIEISKDNGIKVILIKMPVNIPSLISNVSKDADVEAEKNIPLALNYIELNKFQEASAQLNKAVLQNPYSSKAYFYQGFCYEKIKKYDMAEKSFNKAKNLEAFRCKLDSERYNKIMEEVANQYNVPLVDITSVFKKYKEGRLFLDPIHPNAIGHRLIAQEISRIIKRR